MLVPLCSLRMRGLDAQWALRSPAAIATGIERLARLIRHRDCDNPVCHLATYMYGVGPDILWRHANLDLATHEWIGREFGFCPISFFSARSGGRSERA